jgi:uncharacterized protein (TIGR02271 family)
MSNRRNRDNEQTLHTDLAGQVGEVTDVTDASRVVDVSEPIDIETPAVEDTVTARSDTFDTTLSDVVEEEGKIRVPLREERLQAQTVPTQLGSVLFHKRIEEVPSVEDVELHQDDVSVERVSSDELVDAREDPWYEGDTLVIPVYREKIVTETRLVLTELLRVKRKERIEHIMVEGTVRREVVDVEPIVNDASNTTANVSDMINDKT